MPDRRPPDSSTPDFDMHHPQFAVFGHPIGHSLSPSIHQAFGQQCGTALSYRLIDAAPADFAASVRRFFDEGGQGANVTLPHKGAAFALADQHSAAALRVGTANVLTRLSDTQLAAHNTDGAGMVRDLIERHAADLRGRTVLMLGAGGAARGVAWNILDAGVKHLTIVNRSATSADALATAIGDASHAHACRWDELEISGGYDLIVNATSVGVLGSALELPSSLVNPDAICYDLSYGKAAHWFLDWARAADVPAFDGLGMLIETAADAFELWHGQRPVTEPVYQHLRGQIA